MADEAGPLANLPADVTERILCQLTRREASQAALACTLLRDAVRAVAAAAADLTPGGAAFRPRLVVCDSKQNKLIEVDPCAGVVVRQEPAISKKCKRKKFANWPTGVCFGPYGSVLVCQYKVRGVIEHRGGSLEYRREVCTSSERLRGDGPFDAPEGIASGRHAVYFASVDNYSIIALQPSFTGAVPPFAVLDTRQLPPCVVWGLAIGPDDCVYAAVDDTEERDDLPYTHITNQGRGRVLRFEVDPETGRFAPGEAGSVFNRQTNQPGVQPTNQLGVLTRPSGLCFDPVGDLYVTSFYSGVVKFRGPLADEPGRLVGTFIDCNEPRNQLAEMLSLTHGQG